MAPTSLELLARVAWRAWGDGYALYTVCGGCGQMAYCRGPARKTMLCLECFDLGVKARRP